MQKVKVRSGPLKGMIGEGTYFQQSGHYYVTFPDRKNPYYAEEIPPNQIIVLKDQSADPSDPIHEKRESATLQTKKDNVQIIGCKVSCGSVWLF